MENQNNIEIIQSIQATMSIEENGLDTNDISLVNQFLNNEITLEEALNIVVNENRGV